AGWAIRGMQRRTDPAEPTQLQRDIVGSTFVSLEADLTAEATNEGVLGIRFAYERATGREVLPQGEVALARFPDQTVRLFVRDDKSTVTEEWTPLEGAPSLPAGVPFTLAIERTDYDQGEFRVLVNGEVVRSGIESRMLKKVRQQCDGGVLVFAGGSKNVAATCDRVRIVRYRE